MRLIHSLFGNVIFGKKKKEKEVEKDERVEAGQRERRAMAALIDFSCNLLTNSSPDISLSPAIKAQSGTG